MIPKVYEELPGKTIASVEYMAMDTANNTNGNHETLILRFTDGKVLSVWTYGYSLDCLYGNSPISEPKT